MSLRRTAVIVALTVGIFMVLMLFVMATRNVSQIHVLATSAKKCGFQPVPREIRLGFDSLLAWQSQDTNGFAHFMLEKDYDPQLRSAIERSIKNGRDSEVAKWINLVIDHWIITEAGHVRNYEWPGHQTDAEVCAFMSRVFTYRQNNSYSTGDADLDALITRILDKARLH